MTGRPAEGKSPAKSEPIIFLLRALGCLCFRPKGMGGTSVAFPFLTLLFLDACLFKYLHTYVYLFAQASHSNRTTFFLVGLSVSVRGGPSALSLGVDPLHMVFQLRLALHVIVLSPSPSLGPWFQSPPPRTRPPPPCVMMGQTVSCVKGQEGLLSRLILPASPQAHTARTGGRDRFVHGCFLRVGGAALQTCSRGCVNQTWEDWSGLKAWL